MTYRIRPKGEPLKIKVIDRQKKILAPIEVNKLVPLEHPVRAIWDFVGKLNLDSYYQEIKSIVGLPGRPVFSPQLIISLWVLAFSEGVSSAREISRRCGYNPPYQWLTGAAIVNYHTLADFRVGNKMALDELFIQTLGTLNALGLITLDHVMHDGTKIKANAGGDSFHTEKHLQEHLKLARQFLDTTNVLKNEPVSPRIAKAKKRALLEKEKNHEKALIELEEIRSFQKTEVDKKKARASTTDPESRIMKESNGGFAPNYNVQVSTDSVNGIIVAVEATQSRADTEQLLPSILRIQNNMKQKPKQMVVDSGYSSRENVLEIKKQEVDLIGPLFDINERSTNANKINGVNIEEFDNQAFHYNKKKDIYICPAGKSLEYSRQDKQSIGSIAFRYRAQEKDCTNCPFKSLCCPKFTARSISRIEEDSSIIEFRQKMETDKAKDIYKQRSAVAEFSNLWIKTKNGLRQFNVRGLHKVNCELILASLTYNIQIWIRKFWKPVLI